MYVTIFRHLTKTILNNTFFLILVIKSLTNCSNIYSNMCYLYIIILKYNIYITVFNYIKKLFSRINMKNN